MAEDPKWELAILATVQGFYEKLLQESVEGEVPVPAGLETVSLQGDNDVLVRLADVAEPQSVLVAGLGGAV